MCGISGIFDLRGRRAIDPSRLARMNDALAHRGPDGDGTHLVPGVALGHRRLAIRDVEGGRQPMANEDGRVVIVYNGEVYDCWPTADLLRARGHRFVTRCDTEVIVHGWEEWGPAVLDRLNGMFAFAIWDEAAETLFLARDRLGEKPLYYAVDPDGFLLFASELPAVLAGLGRVPELNPQAVEDYFAFGYVPDPKTIYRGIFKLAPGHSLTARRGQALERPRPYWDVPVETDEPGIPDAGVAAEMAARLQRAVAIRMESDVPFGAFLSGGVDSSAVVACMAQASSEPVSTFSIGFADPSVDESAHARRVAARFGTRHTAHRVEPDAAALIDRLAQAYGEPFADSSALPTYLVSQLARSQLTVALSGDGSDEVLGGYRRHRFHVREERVKALLPAAKPLFEGLGRHYPRLDWAPRWLRAKATLEALGQDAVGGLFRAMTLLPDGLRRHLYTGDLTAALQGYNAVEVLRRHDAAAGGPHMPDPLARALYLETKVLLPGGMLVKVDRASMASSLEVRAPFLDHTLVEWAARLPARHKLRGGIGKAVLKRAMEAHLPHDLLYRPKQGFSLPVDSWLRGPLREQVAAALNGGELACSGLLDMRRLRAMAAEHDSGRVNHGRTLWAALMFDAFLRNARSFSAPRPRERERTGPVVVAMGA